MQLLLLGLKKELNMFNEDKKGDAKSLINYSQFLRKLKSAGLGASVSKVVEEETDVKIQEFGEWTEEDFEKILECDLDAWTDDDMLDLYEDDELIIVDEDTGEEIEPVAEEAELDSPVLMEVLSRQERIKSKARMRRTKAKRVRAEKIAIKRFSTPQVANRRARRMAISAMKKRLLRGQNPQKVSIGQKERIERFIHQRRKIVDRLSARMVSRVKQVEKARMSHKRYNKPNNGVTF